MGEIPLAGLLMLLLAMSFYGLAVSTRPDPKMLFLLSLLENFPREDDVGGFLARGHSE